MRHLVRSFQTHVGERGVHFYDESACNFLNWLQVLQFLDSLPKSEEPDPFAIRLEESMANYNPDCQFLAIHQEGKQISVELYSDSSYYVESKN